MRRGSGASKRARLLIGRVIQYEYNPRSVFTMPASDLRLRNTGEYKILRNLSRRFVPDAGGAQRRRASTARRYLCGLDLTTAPIRSAASLVMRPVRRAFFNARRGNLPGIRPWCAHRRGDREFDNSPVGGGAAGRRRTSGNAGGPRRVACARARLAEGAPRAIVSPLAARGAGFINRSFFGDCSSTCTRSEWCMKVYITSRGGARGWTRVGTLACRGVLAAARRAGCLGCGGGGARCLSSSSPHAQMSEPASPSAS